jgi:hypothetical protein
LVRVTYGQGHKDYALKIVDPGKALARAGGAVSYTTDIELGSPAKVTAEVDGTRQIPEAREDNNLLSASLRPRLAISQEVRPMETPVEGVTPSKQEGAAQVEIERVYLKDGRVHVVLRNTGVELSEDDLRQITLNLQVGNRSSSWRLGEIDPRLQLAQGQGTLEFDTGITPQEGADIKVYTKGKGWQLAPMTAVGIPRGVERLEVAPSPGDIVGPANMDLQVDQVYWQFYSNTESLSLYITFSTGNPDIRIVDKDLHFDVLVVAKYRTYPDGGEENSLELVNAWTILPARLSAYGVASLAPVASNRTEDGRAKNRRVELVEQ